MAFAHGHRAGLGMLCRSEHTGNGFQLLEGGLLPGKAGVHAVYALSYARVALVKLGFCRLHLGYAGAHAVYALLDAGLYFFD